MTRFRYAVLTVGFVALISIFSNYTVMNFTFICMRDDLNDAVLTQNGTLRSRYDYSATEKNQILSAVGIGTIVGALPVNWLYLRQGCKLPFLAAGALSILATALVPTAAARGILALLAVRFLQGIAYSADFAAIGIICVKWAPINESAIFIAVLSSFSAFGSAITNAVTGFLCESSLGWKSSYYLHAGFGCLCFLLWILLYTDSPATNKYVGSRELDHIQQGKNEDTPGGKRDIPFKALLRHTAILCVWLNAFMEMMSTILLTMYSPLYFRNILQFGISETGYYVGLSIALQLPFKFTAAIISDKCTMFSKLTKMLFFNTVAVGLVGVVFCVLGFIDPSRRFWAVVAVTMVNCFSSMNCGAFYKCASLVARQYADVVIAAIQFAKCIALVTGPTMFAVVVRDEFSRAQWTVFFCINGALLIAANFTSYLFFTDEPAEFTHREKSTDYELVNESNS